MKTLLKSIAIGGIVTLTFLALQHPKAAYYLLIKTPNVLWDIVQGRLDIHIHDSYFK